MTSPTDLNPAEQIGLGAGHTVEPRGLEGRAFAEDHRIWGEAEPGAVFSGRPQLFDAAQGLAATKGLAPFEAILEGSDFQPLREGIDHRDADPVQTAGGFVGLAAELTPRMQDGHDDLQRRLTGVFGVRVDRHAAPVILDGEHAVGIEDYLDQLGVTGDGLVHGIVKHLSEQVVQGAFVRTADIHAWAFAHGLQALQDLDVFRGIAVGTQADARLMNFGERCQGRRVQRVIEKGGLGQGL